MLRAPPQTIMIPYRAIVDRALLDAERVTLALLYARADQYGVVEETALSLMKIRRKCANTMRRHLYRLEELQYLVPINKACRLEREPLRQSAEGYALLCQPNGRQWQAAQRVAQSMIA